MTKKVDAYVAADFVWASLPRGTCRVQMFHVKVGSPHAARLVKSI